MSDLERKLTDMLAERADRVDRPTSRLGEIRSRLDQLESSYPPVDRRRWRSGSRAFAGIAAAFVVGIGVGGLMVMQRQIAAPDADPSILGQSPSTIGDPQKGIVTGRAIRWAPPSPLPDPEHVFVAADVVDEFGVSDTATKRWPSSVTVERIVQFLDGYVAAGTETVGSHSFAAVWRSADGLTWERVETPSFTTGTNARPADQYGTSIGAIAANEERAVAIGGVRADGATVLTAWATTDGSTWSSTPLNVPPSEPAVINADVVTTAIGFVALTLDAGVADPAATSQATLLRSADGFSWETLPGPGAETAGARIYGLTTVGSRLVAFGQVGGSLGQAAAWFSDDNGTTWTTASVTSTGALPITTARAAAGLPDGVLMLGYSSTEQPHRTLLDGGPLEPIGSIAVTAWWSPDGVHFEALDTAPLNTAFDVPTAVARTQAGALMATSRISGTQPSTLLWSWTLDGGFAPLDTSAADLQQITALDAVRDGYLAASRNPRTAPNDQSAPADTALWMLQQR